MRVAVNRAFRVHRMIGFTDRRANITARREGVTVAVVVVKNLEETISELPTNEKRCGSLSNMCKHFQYDKMDFRLCVIRLRQRVHRRIFQYLPRIADARLTETEGGSSLLK